MAGGRGFGGEVLEARRRILGEEHPDTLNSISNLARTLAAQGDLAGARRLEEPVLEARRRILGEEHPDTLTSMDNLARTIAGPPCRDRERMSVVDVSVARRPN